VQTCIQPCSWYHCHSLSLASVKFRLVLPFWYRLTRVVWDEGPLNGCMYVRFRRYPHIQDTVFNNSRRFFTWQVTQYQNAGEMILFIWGLPCVQCTKNRLTCENYTANYKIFQTYTKFQRFPVLLAGSNFKFQEISRSCRHTDIHNTQTGFTKNTSTLHGGWLGSRVVACWTQAQKDLGSNRSHDAVG